MLAVAAFAGAAVLFVVGAVVVDVVRDDLGNGTTEPVETAAEEEGDAPSSDLPRAYVVTRTRDNPTILSPVYEEFVSLTLDPGMYQVWGKLGVSNRDGERSFQVECTLVPSDADGTPRGTERAGEAGSDYGDLRLGPHDTPGDSARFRWPSVKCSGRRGPSFWPAEDTATTTAHSCTTARSARFGSGRSPRSRRRLPSSAPHAKRATVIVTVAPSRPLVPPGGLC
jgi:hypothetical protein